MTGGDSMKMLSISLSDEIERELENISNKDNFVVDAVKEKLKRERNKIVLVLFRIYRVFILISSMR